MLVTPSKRLSAGNRRETDKMHQKAPLSDTQNNFLNDLFTPSTHRTTGFPTPDSQIGVSTFRCDDTPAFLRRDSQRGDVGTETVLGDEEGVSWSPVAIRKLPKAAGRGLSALVRGLREMEDEDLDEELAMLREMESESAPKKHLGQPKIQVNDSQRPDMPLGPDGGLESDENDVDYADRGEKRDGKPLKVWKKKGQKRTTRRVLMKPNTAKWKPESAWKVDQAHGDEDGVAETQTVSADQSTDWKNHGCDSREFEGVEGRQETMKAGSGRRDASDNDLEKKAGSVMKVKKKISATAHANFRALKIKNKQSKAKKAGRFGRKR